MEENRLRSLVDRELNTMEIRLQTKTQRTALTLEEYIQTRILQGSDIEIIKRDLLLDLETGGRIFGEFRNAIRATVHGNMMRIADASQFADQGTKVKYRWVAVLVNTCPDCLALHNQIMTWGDWEVEGMPRTGHTVCGENCKCVLIPEEMVDENQQPIKRTRI